MVPKQGIFRGWRNTTQEKINHEVRIPSWKTTTFFVEKIHGTPQVLWTVAHLRFCLSHMTLRDLWEPSPRQRVINAIRTGSRQMLGGKKTHSQGWHSLQRGPKKRPVIFGRVKFISTQNGWNNLSYKFRQIQIVWSTIFKGGWTAHMVETKQQVHQ